MTFFEIAVLVLLVATLATSLATLLRSGGSQGTVEFNERLNEVVSTVQAGLVSFREEAANGNRLAREELGNSLNGMSTALSGTITVLGTGQSERLDGFAKLLTDNHAAAAQQAKALREELTGNIDKLVTSLSARLTEQAGEQTRKLDSFALQLSEHRKGAGEEAKGLREEVSNTLSSLGARLESGSEVAAKKQQDGLMAVVETVKQLSSDNERRQETLRQTVEVRLDAIRSENGAKLEEMRQTVDEKLQRTLEARLGASFNQVNENLERVFRSVGEMQAIATGVGDLKRVLSNVKTRGTWGEGNLGLLLEQVMTPEQYAQNVEVRPNSGQRVEFAIRLPGEGDQPLWLPIDAKLPTEDYERLILASEAGDPGAVEDASKALERRIRTCAKDISEKYVAPPHTTDFGVMFLPTEGLFAEVVRRPGLIDTLQRENRVVVTGPTTLMALLTSLRMGFRSLAIQKRSSEVWQVLGAVKTEFGKFGDVLDKVHKKLGEAQTAVEQVGTRRRVLDRKLRGVDALPEAASHALLESGDGLLVDELTEAAFPLE
jgi:DNA recombination protein RmuC